MLLIVNVGAFGIGVCVWVFLGFISVPFVTIEPSMHYSLLSSPVSTAANSCMFLFFFPRISVFSAEYLVSTSASCFQHLVTAARVLHSPVESVRRSCQGLRGSLNRV